MASESKADLELGLRRNANSNPVNPHDAVGAAGLLRGDRSRRRSAANAAIETHLGNISRRRRLQFCGPRTAIAWQLAPKTVLRTGFGYSSDILPEAWPI